jgi:DNA-directed RNA polymerase specialized sigma24 family protein
MDAPANVLPTPMPARPVAETDWPAFIDSYGRVALAWFRQSGLPLQDLHSVAGDFLTALYQDFRAVAEEPALKFRPWLQFAAHAAWCDVLERKTAPEGEDESSLKAALLASVEAHDEFLRALDNECSRQRRAEAQRHVQSVAEAADWEAFSLAVLQQKPLAEVAAEFQCQDTAIRAALYRVRLRLHEEYVRMEEKS